MWYFYPRRFRGKSPKWQKMYTGPYLIVKHIQPSNYVIQKSKTAKPKVVHADKLKAWSGDHLPSWLPPTTEDGTAGGTVVASSDNGNVSAGPEQEVVVGGMGDDLEEEGELGDTHEDGVVAPLPDQESSDESTENVSLSKRPARVKRPPRKFKDYRI